MRNLAWSAPADHEPERGSDHDENQYSEEHGAAASAPNLDFFHGYPDRLYRGQRVAMHESYGIPLN
ncbi:MAG: hypothetical protein M3Y05_07990 [Gemmatimonadota bacterium]|nr:hypothetical protein [Gemmatimonadota bacterium]